MPNITRKDVTTTALKQTLYFDGLLDNQETISAEVIGAWGAKMAKAIPPPFNFLVQALILADVASIHAYNKGNGVGFNINADASLLLGIPPVVTHKVYFTRSYPFAGTWKLNLAESKFGGLNKPPKEATLVFEEQGGQEVGTLKGVRADGSLISSETTVSITGGEPEGAPTGISVVVAKKTLTVTTKGTDAQGKAYEDVQVYDKQ